MARLAFSAAGLAPRYRVGASGDPTQPVRRQGRSTRRTGEVVVAVTAGSISPRRCRCRKATCTVDLDKPVRAAIACRLTPTVSRRARVARPSKCRYTTNAAGRLS